MQQMDMTELAEFTEVDLNSIAGTFHRPLILDGHLLQPEQVRAAGVEYVSVGRTEVRQK